MGYNMAANIRKKMVPHGILFIQDISRDACDRFVQEFGDLGAIEIANSPKAGVDQSNTIITMVPRGENVKEVYLQGPGAVIDSAKGNRLILECSTIDVQTTREVGEKVIQADLGNYYDAPVSVSHSAK